jgi:TonB family protein
MKSTSLRLLFAVLTSLALHGAATFAAYLGTSHNELVAARPLGSNLRALQMVLPERPENVRVHTSIHNTHDVKPPSASVAMSAATENPQPKTGGVQSLATEDATFFHSNQLSRPAEPAMPVALDSSDLGPLPRGGRAVLTIWVSSSGSVVETRVDSSDVPERFARYAEEAFRKTAFLPGERNGRPVGTIMRIELQYDDLTDPAG